MRISLDTGLLSEYNSMAIGVWRSLVSRLVRVQEASGSNPDTPTTRKRLETDGFQAFFMRTPEKYLLRIHLQEGACFL